MPSKRERLDAFPTQLVLAVIWTIVGLPLCIVWGRVLLWTQLMSAYAIIVTHFTGHIAWRAKRIAQKTLDEETK